MCQLRGDKQLALAASKSGEGLSMQVMFLLASPKRKKHKCAAKLLFQELCLPFPQVNCCTQIRAGLKTKKVRDRGASGEELKSRSEQPQAVQSTLGRVTYSKGQAARRQHRSPKWPLNPIRTALKKKNKNKTKKPKHETESLKSKCSFQQSASSIAE